MEFASTNPTEFDRELPIKLIRVLVVISLELRFFLYLLPPLRKRIVNKFMLGLISLLFSLSDSIPAFTLALICSRAVLVHEHDGDQANDTIAHDPHLLAWASLMFLVLAGHGHERKTPYSLQRGEIANESFRVFLKFVFYGKIFLITFIFLFPSSNIETTLEALAFVLVACTQTFNKLKGLHDRRNEMKKGPTKAKFPTTSLEVRVVTEFMREKKVIIYAHELFQNSQWLICGHYLPYYDGIESSKSPYLQLSPEGACKIVDVEHSLMYGKFYGGVLPSLLEMVIPLLSIGFMYFFCPSDAFSEGVMSMIFVVSLLLILGINEAKLLASLNPKHKPDYKLFSFRKLLLTLSGIFLVILGVTLLICSGTNFQPESTLFYILTFNLITIGFTSIITGGSGAILLMGTSPRAPSKRVKNKIIRVTIEVIQNFLQTAATSFYPKFRWSGTIPQLNFLAHSLKQPSKLSASLDYMLNQWSVSDKVKYKDDVGKFIFSQLKEMTLEASKDIRNKEQNIARQIIASKGQWFLKRSSNLANCHETMTEETLFEERLLMWHIATGILYHTITREVDYNMKMSMLLSDYMGYILIAQPWIMSEKRGAVLQIISEIKTEINEMTESKRQPSETQNMLIKRFCKQLRERQSPSPTPVDTTTVLRDACNLARKLESMFADVHQRWSVIAKVWVEMLAYAAISSEPMDHIRSLSQGGELASIVWLWLAHSGYLKHFCKRSLPQPDPNTKTQQHYGLLSHKYNH